MKMKFSKYVAGFCPATNEDVVMRKIGLAKRFEHPKNWDLIFTWFVQKHVVFAKIHV